jgi:ApbE superfamily uncharacterized protein (UPF0280 family)
MADPARLQVRRLPQGRLHLSDGPIDLILQAWGEQAEIARAYNAACDCMLSVLDRLCDELPALRASQPGPALQGPVARRMQAAVAVHAADGFITPMAAVAGAVADHVLAAMTDAAELRRASVNNGGDIALHLMPDEAFGIGIARHTLPPRLLGTVRITAEQKVRGIATSGWRGRSHSLGIADAVTVLARSAADADAAATMIANAVDLPGHPGILRAPARSLAPDSDLGARLVTTGVLALPPDSCVVAVSAGAAVAERLRGRDVIIAAFLHLQGETRVVGTKEHLLA